MAANRIAKTASKHCAPKMPASIADVIPYGFTICPPQLALAQPWQQEIYRLAYERAKAATQLPRHHRLLFSVWN